MKNNKLNQIAGSACLLGLVSTVATAIAPNAAHACACGCGVFDVATSSMFPADAGGMAFLNYDYQDQNRNWTGTAAGGNGDDKKIETHFVTAGLQYMFNRSWGAQVEIPVVNRTFDSAGNSASLNWIGLGDIRLKGIYTGFSEDLSSGLTFGVKLPTGSANHTEPLGDIDRDTQIGSGSTDVLLGGFHRARFGNSSWNWFAQAELDIPTLKRGDYRPGLEADAAAGIYYDGLSLGRAKISPVAQVIGSWRGRDNGAAAAPDDSGYQRVLLSPGIEVHLHPVKIYADVELPVYQNMNGNQLVAPALFKLSISYIF